jgi:hypothetical protein
MTKPPRPGPFLWLLYALGRGLPPRNREWVLYDVTTRTWVLRHLLRATVQLAPVAVLLYLLMPGSSGVRIGAVLGGLALGYFYSLAYMYETTENRAMKAGYPRGTARELRDRRTAVVRDEQARRYAGTPVRRAVPHPPARLVAAPFRPAGHRRTQRPPRKPTAPPPRPGSLRRRARDP